MRRGHPGIGGWRGENPRHFRPRSGGTPHFRPPRNYGMPDVPRFPPPGARMHRPSRFTHPGLLDDRGPLEHQDRNKYRGGSLHNSPQRPDRLHHRDRGGSRQIFPFIQHLRHKDDHSSYQDSSNYYNDINETGQCRVNSMGDVDHRQNILQNREPFIQRHPISLWAHPPNENKRHYYEDRSLPKSYRHDSGEPNKIPLLDYPGHRPPSSDHYGSTPSLATNNNNTSFSRSVDDTVDIVRKRLMNRNESQRLSVDQAVDQTDDDPERDTNSSYQNVQQEQPTKKRIQRQKQIVKSNCDKMKNNIVHQLFKMDKDKIHKLMDNPNSSTKFEYAISSLITESQNSLNRHLRSVAEKSLCSSSTDFIHNDNNTIYEDTFMKQMQCILDPQDTVLLEDIKPLVMAELSKVLQLDSVDQIYDFAELEDHVNYNPIDEHSNQYHNEPYNYEDYHEEKYYALEQTPEYTYQNIDNLVSIETNQENEFNLNTQSSDIKPLFERRPLNKSTDYEEERRKSSESRQIRSSIDNKTCEDRFKTSPEQLPLFDADAEQFSEEEDQFAELDKQYHVAVDPNFIEPELYSSPQQVMCSGETLSYQNELPSVPNEIQISKVSTFDIKKEIDDELRSIAKSPLKFTSIPSNNETEQKTIKNIDGEIKSKTLQKTQSVDIHKGNMPTKINNKLSETSSEIKVLKNVDIKQENVPKPKEVEKKEPDKSEDSSSTVKSSMSSNSRKRSTDQRPSHRKEKRKKSETSPSDSNKQILNKNIIINVNDCAVKKPEKCREAAKSIFNLYFSKNAEGKDAAKDSMKVQSADKTYSDKYVKRKEPQKKSKDREIKLSKKRSFSLSSHPLISPKDTSNLSGGNRTPTKPDPKTKLKPIDMFMGVPKIVNLHQALRNTTPAAVGSNKTMEENKPKLHEKLIKTTVGKDTARPSKRLQTKETQTFESKSSTSRFCQTEVQRLVSRSVQTDPESFEKSGPKSTEAFERMKEIDLEIQVLLQEKFKLYSSLESKDSQSSLQALGMTVLNVTPFDETKQDEENGIDNALSEDAIVDDFTNIPVEELEQIAFETVQEDKHISGKPERRVRRHTQKLLEHQHTNLVRPTVIKRSKKAKTPNISLIEQIITDDRPLEDIIVLDEYEHPPVKSAKTKSQKSHLKKKATKKNKPTRTVFNMLKSFITKECSVVLIREDLNKYLKAKSEEPPDEKELTTVPVPPSESPVLYQSFTQEGLDSTQGPKTEIIEETVENDLQFDMLDVSEDIVIGDNCEVKSRDNDINERIDVPLTEEIILDNSQSSSDDVYVPDAVQGESECKMYDYSTDENLRRDSITVTGNADAVLAIECIENNFIAACLDGNVYHFSGDGQLLNTLRGSNLAVTCLTIVKEKYGTTVYTGSLDSRIRYYDLDTGVEKGPECNVLSPIQTMDRAWDTVFVGTRTGFVLQFECKNNMLIPVSTVKFSEQSILALRAMKEGPRKVLLVAARSENVTVKDAQTGLLLRTLVGPKMTVYTLLFEDGKVYCGTSSHQIHVFDYASGGHVGVHEGGKGAVCLRATGGLVFAGCYDGCVYVYREGETRPLAQLRGPGLMLLSLAVLDTKIIAGYKDRSLYIWKIPLCILQEMIL